MGVWFDDLWGHLSLMLSLRFVLVIAFVDKFEHLSKKFHIDGNYNLLTSAGSDIIWIIFHFNIWVYISRFNVGVVSNPFSKGNIGNVPEPSTSITSLPWGEDRWVLNLHVKPLFVLLVSWLKNLHVFIVYFLTLFLTFRLKFCWL